MISDGVSLLAALNMLIYSDMLTQDFLSLRTSPFAKDYLMSANLRFKSIYAIFHSFLPYIGNFISMFSAKLNNLTTNSSLLRKKIEYLRYLEF